VLFYQFNRGPVNVKDLDAKAITAVDLYQAFRTDTTAGSKLYSGKVMQVTGIVNSIALNQQKGRIVLLKTSIPGAYINCTLEYDVPAAEVDSMLTLRGICSGIGQGDEDLGIKADVYLSRCILIK